MEFLIKKASNWNYKEIKKIKNLKELLNFQKMCGDPIIIEPLDDYEKNDITEKHKIISEIMIYDDWIE